MLKKVDHVTLVVKDLDKAVKDYEKILHLTPERGRSSELEEIKLAMLPVKDGARIELIEPKPNCTNRIGKFLKERGEGVFGLSVFMDDFDAEVKALKEKGVKVEEKSSPQCIRVIPCAWPGYRRKRVTASGLSWWTPSPFLLISDNLNSLFYR